MTKALKTLAFNSVGQLIESQPMSDGAGAKMTPHPLLCQRDRVTQHGGGTPPAARGIPVCATPYSFGESPRSEKKSRRLKICNGVGGVARG
jgi:hypothetical protein